MVRPVLLLFTGLMTQGCTSRMDAARDLFMQAKTCPAERVQVRELEGLTLHARREKKRMTNAVQAPDDVRADPARLALWQAQQAEAARIRQWIDERFLLYRASGCGQQQDYACEFLWSQKGWPRGRCDVLSQKLID
ncbi:hypothetical protein [Comamonas flocculans]|uniref:Uncharacterized protein n=1 Tax=Comamonas flocculans TaxID=2597701 RepID=A0A5B8RTW5_9BURK|nr:hypothetical protein [Comamonas flocculans]QEA12951.1 hypothetical protein FOZ74_07875 [Comamonas flocculans]